jgi:phosphoribosylamine--glycine ligase
MKVLVVGGGGREHALAWKLAQSPRVQMVYVAPGNAGTAADPLLCNVAIADPDALVAFALAERIALTVVGPEGPLAAGLVDRFREHDLRIFGPTQAAARLESSKAYAKDFMRRHAIPTADYATFDDAAAAHAHVEAGALPIVVKADGLAAGKGVVVAATRQEAHAAIDAMFATGAGARVVVEEFLEGEEASFIVLCDGRRVVPLATSQDHKRLRDGDTGPNTGGMGAYSPAAVVTPNVHARVMHEIILPTVAGMAADGVPFSGFLYAGLMIDADGHPRTVEFNCRLGDPEAQVLMLRLKNDLFELLMQATATPPEETLPEAIELHWDRRVALGVVMAAHGYPEAPRAGDRIVGLPAPSADAMVFHAGTAERDGAVVTAGGRILCVVALGDSVKLAQQHAYQVLQGVYFEGAQYRHDIGHRGIRR